MDKPVVHLKGMERSCSDKVNEKLLYDILNGDLEKITMNFDRYSPNKCHEIIVFQMEKI